MKLYWGQGLAALGIWLAWSATAWAGGPYLEKGDGTILDQGTGLLWQKADDGVQRNWAEAGSYCKSLRLAGHEDWMLPSAHMLEGLVDGGNAPTIDPIFAAQSSYYWSASATNQQAAKYVNFAYGNSYSYNKDNRYYVRCVRQAPPEAGSDLTTLPALSSPPPPPIPALPPAPASPALGAAKLGGAERVAPALTRNPPVVPVEPPLVASPPPPLSSGAGTPLPAPLAELAPAPAAAASKEPGPPAAEAPVDPDFQEFKESPAGASGAPPEAKVVAENPNQPAWLEIDASQTRRPVDAPSLPQGVLAYSFVNGLKGDADWNKDGILMGREMKAFIGVGVENLTQGTGPKPEIAMLGPDFPICAEPEGTTHVLAVGIDGYADKRISPVPLAGLGAQMVQLIVGKQCKTAALNLVLGPQADRRGVVARLAALKSTVKAADTLIIYFAGASLGLGEERLLLPQDADLDLVAFSSLRVADLHTYLARLPVRKVILLFEAGAAVAAGAGE